MKISDRRLRISDCLKISDFSNSLGVLQHPKHPQQYAYVNKYVSSLSCIIHFYTRALRHIRPALTESKAATLGASLVQSRLAAIINRQRTAIAVGHQPVPNYIAWWQKHISVNNLSKLTTQGRPARVEMSNLRSLNRKSNALLIVPPRHTKFNLAKYAHATILPSRRDLR